MQIYSVSEPNKYLCNLAKIFKTVEPTYFENMFERLNKGQVPGFPQCTMSDSTTARVMSWRRASPALRQSPSRERARVVRARVPGSEEEIPAVRHNSALSLNDGDSSTEAARLAITRAVNAVVVDSSGPSSYKYK